MAPTLLKGKQSRDLSLYDTNRHQPKTSCIFYGQNSLKIHPAKVWTTHTGCFSRLPELVAKALHDLLPQLAVPRKVKGHVGVMCNHCETKEWQQKITRHLNFTQQKSQNTRWESWKYQFRTNFSFRSFFLYSCENLSWSLILLCWCYRGSQHWKWRRKWATYRPAKNGIPIMVYLL